MHCNPGYLKLNILKLNLQEKSFYKIYFDKSCNYFGKFMKNKFSDLFIQCCPGSSIHTH